MTYYKTYPATCPRDEFWVQVRRMVGGKPVSEEQIQMIVAAAQEGLELRPGDFFLDLCCGNGALSMYFFKWCSRALGVDYSEPLIDVAREYFEQPPDYVFQLGDVVDYVNREPDPGRFTKALCYGALQCLPREGARSLLHTLRKRFVHVTRLYLGNLPDRNRVHNFPPALKQPLDDPDTPLGIWWTQKEVVAVAMETGWDVTFKIMPKDFFAAHYRFDAVLTPRQ